jgi:hypothetical protein
LAEVEKAYNKFSPYILLPDLAALQRNVDMTKAPGYAQASFDVKIYSDLSMVKEAATRLKQEQN